MKFINIIFIILIINLFERILNESFLKRANNYTKIRKMTENKKLITNIYYSKKENNYYIKLYLGDSKIPQTFIIDTTFPIISSPCNLCHICHNRHFPFYNINIERDLIKCNSQKCLSIMNSNNCEEENCYFKIGNNLNDNKNIEGYLVNINIFINNTDNYNAISFLSAIPIGCTIKEENFYKNNDKNGIIGLNNNKNTLIDIMFNLNIIQKNIFSICLQKKGGYLSIGEINDISNDDINYINIISSSLENHLFEIKMDYIEIEGEQKFQEYIAYIDSSNNFSYFPDNIYKFIFQILEKDNKIDYFTYDEQYGYCRKFNDSKEKNDIYELFPNIFINFEGYNFEWESHNYIIENQMEENNLISICLGFKKTLEAIDKIILGANFLFGNKIVFDKNNHKIGFSKTDCDLNKNEKDKNNNLNNQLINETSLNSFSEIDENNNDNNNSEISNKFENNNSNASNEIKINEFPEDNKSIVINIVKSVNNKSIIDTLPNFNNSININVISNINSINIDDNIRDKIINDNVKISENLTNNIINENITNDIINENITNDIVNENIMNDSISDDLINDSLRADLINDIIKDIINENIIYDNLSYDLINDNKIDDLINDNITDDLINYNKIDEINNSLIDNLINDTNSEIINETVFDSLFNSINDTIIEYSEETKIESLNNSTNDSIILIANSTINNYINNSIKDITNNNNIINDSSLIKIELKSDLINENNINNYSFLSENKSSNDIKQEKELSQSEKINNENLIKEKANNENNNNLNDGITVKKQTNIDIDKNIEDFKNKTFMSNLFGNFISFLKNKLIYFLFAFFGVILCFIVVILISCAIISCLKMLKRRHYMEQIDIENPKDTRYNSASLSSRSN